MIGTAVYDGDGRDANTSQLTAVRTNAEIFPSYVTTQTASNAYKCVLSDVGCNLPVPDVIDKRIIGEVLDGTTHYEGTNGPTYTINGFVQPIASQSQLSRHHRLARPMCMTPMNSPNYPWPAYATYNVPVDSDHDGLPDWWELAHGTNPNSRAGRFLR